MNTRLKINHYNKSANNNIVFTLQKMNIKNTHIQYF